MTKRIIILSFLLTIILSSYGQHMCLTFQEAEKLGLSTDFLEYQPAIHADSSLAVFKTDEDIELLFLAWPKLLKDLGSFIADNDFVWEGSVKCMNKVYFSPDGSIDYFLFNFYGDDKNNHSKVDIDEFKRLLNLFIQEYKLEITADVKFSQCGGSVFVSENNK